MLEPIIDFGKINNKDDVVIKNGYYSEKGLQAFPKENLIVESNLGVYRGSFFLHSKIYFLFERGIRSEDNRNVTNDCAYLGINDISVGYDFQDFFTDENNQLKKDSLKTVSYWTLNNSDKSFTYVNSSGAIDFVNFKIENNIICIFQDGVFCFFDENTNRITFRHGWQNIQEYAEPITLKDFSLIGFKVNYFGIGYLSKQIDAEARIVIRSDGADKTAGVKLQEEIFIVTDKTTGALKIAFRALYNVSGNNSNYPIYSYYAPNYPDTSPLPLGDIIIDNKTFVYFNGESNQFRFFLVSSLNNLNYLRKEEPLLPISIVNVDTYESIVEKINAQIEKVRIHTIAKDYTGSYNWIYTYPHPPSAYMFTPELGHIDTVRPEDLGFNDTDDLPPNNFYMLDTNGTLVYSLGWYIISDLTWRMDVETIAINQNTTILPKLELSETPLDSTEPKKLYEEIKKYIEDNNLPNNPDDEYSNFNIDFDFWYNENYLVFLQQTFTANENLITVGDISNDVFAGNPQLYTSGRAIDFSATNKTFALRNRLFYVDKTINNEYIGYANLNMASKSTVAWRQINEYTIYNYSGGVTPPSYSATPFIRKLNLVSIDFLSCLIFDTIKKAIDNVSGLNVFLILYPQEIPQNERLKYEENAIWYTDIGVDNISLLSWFIPSNFPSRINGIYGEDRDIYVITAKSIERWQIADVGEFPMNFISVESIFDFIIDWLGIDRFSLIVKNNGEYFLNDINFVKNDYTVFADNSKLCPPTNIKGIPFLVFQNNFENYYLVDTQNRMFFATKENYIYGLSEKQFYAGSLPEFVNSNGIVALCEIENNDTIEVEFKLRNTDNVILNAIALHTANYDNVLSSNNPREKQYKIIKDDIERNRITDKIMIMFYKLGKIKNSKIKVATNGYLIGVSGDFEQIKMV